MPVVIMGKWADYKALGSWFDFMAIGFSNTAKADLSGSLGNLWEWYSELYEGYSFSECDSLTVNGIFSSWETPTEAQP